MAPSKCFSTWFNLHHIIFTEKWVKENENRTTNTLLSILQVKWVWKEELKVFCWSVSCCQGRDVLTLVCADIQLALGTCRRSPTLTTPRMQIFISNLLWNVNSKINQHKCQIPHQHTSLQPQEFLPEAKFDWSPSFSCYLQKNSK